MDKTSKNLLILSAVLLLTVAGIFMYYREKPIPSGVSPQVSPTPFMPPSDWQTIENENYMISFPDSFEAQDNGENSLLLVPSEQGPGVGPANFIYVSFVPSDLRNNNDGLVYNYNPDQIKKLEELEIGESVSVADAGIGQDEWYTYTRVDDTTIDGTAVKVYENNKPWEFPAGTTETRYILNKNGEIYLMGYYTGGEGVADSIDPRQAYRTIHTLKTK